ncbi:MAG: Ran-binding zinc finger domain-containing protein [bacterium]
MTNEDTGHDSATSEASGNAGATLVAVSALMGERRRFEGWISTLEARRTTTAEHVFSRVHADYTGRLEAVITQLKTHIEGLRHELDSLTGRLGGIRTERQRAEDERAEAELRAVVGELSAVDWEATSAASAALLSELAARHSEVEQELQKTRELLESAQRPATPAAAAAPVAPVAAAPAVVPEAPAAPKEPEAVAAAPLSAPAQETKARESEQAAAAPRAPAFRVIHQTPAPGMLPIEQHALEMDEPSAPRNQAPRKSSFDELAFLSSVVDTPSGSIEPAPTDQADEKSRRDSFAMRSKEETTNNGSESGGAPLSSPNADQMVARSPRADAMIGRDSLVDGAKTLKCSECSAMNYPTEWYCERCGAELASL